MLDLTVNAVKGHLPRGRARLKAINAQSPAQPAQRPPCPGITLIWKIDDVRLIWINAFSAHDGTFIIQHELKLASRGTRCQRKQETRCR
jgi:hypothetical protein